jgi:Uma2 family endonuclease
MSTAKDIRKKGRPKQGQWTVDQYLAFTDGTNRFIEYTDGFLEKLPMPTDRHQCILEFLLFAFTAYLKPRGGKAHLAVLRLQVGPRKFREPDLLLVLSATDPRRQNRFWIGADLVLEVVSPDKPERDLVDKVADYAAAGIPEYWIVNPLTETISVLALDGAAYIEAGVFRRGGVATSVLLAGFALNVSEVFDAD